MRVNIQDLAEDGLDSDDEWMHPNTGQAGARGVSPNERTPALRPSPFGVGRVPNFGTM